MRGAVQPDEERAVITRGRLRVLSTISVLAGAILVSTLFWGCALDGAFSILLKLKWFFCLQWYYGVPLFALGLLGILLTQPENENPPSRFQRHRLGFSAVGFGLIANLLIYIVSRGLFSVPTGASIRPMGWSAVVFLIVVAAFAVVVPVAVAAIVKERPRWPGVLGLLFGLAPFWLAEFLLHYAMSVRGFHLSP